MFQGIDQVRSLLHADTREKRIIDAVRMPAEVSTPEVIRRLEEIFDQYFPGKKRQSWMMKWKKQNHQRHMLFADAEHSFERKKNAEDVDVHMHGAGAAEENFRKYLSNYFGKPLYDLAETRQIEQELCSGADTGCHLFYTDGEYADVMEKGSFIVTNDRSAEKYEGSNKEAYERNMDVYHHVINQLTARIRNSVLVHLEEQTVRATKGRIDVKRIWRGLYLDESRIFEKKLPGDHGNITVDILLDASDSQTPRRETIAAQGYILAESLTRCHIPVRIVSFCSLHGFTVMTKYRDYDETDKNARIFRYFTGGCNRDGLGIRMLTRMIQESSAQHRLFIVVSDCKPQDGARMKDKTGTYIDYTGEAAVNATADSVRRAIAQGIRVMCIYTGEDAEVANAAKIFDRHFVRIHNLDRMAEAVGNLLQSVISSMDV